MSIATCSCNNCSGHLKFESSQAGQTVRCPHCGMRTTLFLPQVSPDLPQEFPPTSRPAREVRIIVFTAAGSLLFMAGLLWLLIAKPNPRKALERACSIATAMFASKPPPTNAPLSKPPAVPKTFPEMIDLLESKPALMTAEEKAARDNILKALLDVTSATALGVTRAHYSELLIKALSTLSFEKTKLSAKRHAKYLMCAVKAIEYYDKANEAWSDYSQYELTLKGRWFMTPELLT